MTECSTSILCCNLVIVSEFFVTFVINVETSRFGIIRVNVIEGEMSPSCGECELSNALRKSGRR